MLMTANDEITQTGENEHKSQIVKNVVSERFEDASVPEVVEFMAQKKQIPVEDLTDDDREYAEYLVNNYHRERQFLIDEILSAPVPIDDIEEFSRNILLLSDKLKTGKANARDAMYIAKSPLSLEESKQYIVFSDQWISKHIGTDPSQIDPDVQKERLGILNGLITSISGSNTSPRPQTMEPAVRAGVFHQFDQLYSFLFAQDSSFDRDLSNSLRFGIERLAIQRQAPEEAQIFFDMAMSAIQNETKDIAKIFMDRIQNYGLHFGLDEQKQVGLMNNLLPAIKNNDADVEILIRGGNIWGTGEGNFGVADFICHCYAQPITPENISELLIASREAPTTSLSRFEQNRKDALSLRAQFGALRDYIHDQRPGVHTLISLMVAYYDAPQTEKDKIASQIKQETAKTGGYLAGERTDMILELSRYDQDIEEDFQGQQKTVKAIDVLRRVAKNTEPVDEAAPTTSHAEINDALKVIDRRELLGKVDIEQASLVEAIKVFCDFLESKMGEKTVGIEPSTILALSWLERRVFEFLQNMSFEKQMGAYKTDWFEQIMRFSELTSSPVMFDKQGFTDFIEELRQKSPHEAYRFIGQRVISNVSELTKNYKGKPGEYRMGALWSGNVTHELIGLIDWKPAETQAGNRLRKEWSLPEEDRLKGD